MKIIYVPTITEKIDNITPAIDTERELRCIELTPKEMVQFNKEMRERNGTNTPLDGCCMVIYKGMTIQRGR